MMPGHDIVVIGASAGGVEALSQLVRRLPADLPAAIFVVLHVPAHSPSLLPQILERKGPLPARHPSDGEAIGPGRISVAPPDQHLLLEGGRVRLIRGPAGERASTGGGPAVPDGGAGVRPPGRRRGALGQPRRRYRRAGGDQAAGRRRRSCRTPRRPSIPACPAAPIESVAVDHILPVAGIAELLDHLAREPIADPADPPMPEDMESESRIAAFDLDAIEDEDRPGQPSGFSCPDCGGTLWELQDGELFRFRCRVGHAWTANGLVAEQTERDRDGAVDGAPCPGGARGAVQPGRRADARARS